MRSREAGPLTLIPLGKPLFVTNTCNKVLAVIPVFEDWEALGLLLQKLDQVVEEQSFSLSVLLVDDGSATTRPEALRRTSFRFIREIKVLSLRRNLGHQRAICIALAYAEEQDDNDAVVVMDGDGEDAPEDVPRLIYEMREVGGGRVVFAERTRRSERWFFQLCYRLYQALHWLLTGIRVRVGNFSVIPRDLLSRLVVVSELWNHYAAAVFKSRLPFVTLKTRRAKRLGGRSRMDFVGLVIHGLSALSVHGERIGVRMTVATLLAVLCLALALGSLAISTSEETSAVPSWLPIVTGIVLLLLGQAIVLGIVFVFVILQARVSANFIPIRDYRYFVQGVEDLAGQAVPASLDAASG